MENLIWLIILGSAVVTILPRILPLTFLTGVSLSPAILDVLSGLPLAILTALLAAELFAPTAQGSAVVFKWLAVLLALLTAWRTDHLLWTVLVGMGTLAALRFLCS